MAKQDEQKIENVSDFFQKVMKEIKDIQTLTVKTVIGDLKHTADDNYQFDQNTQVDGIVSDINLLKGDAITKMSKSFAKDHPELREYHLQKEKEGHEIIRKNLEVIRDLAKTLFNLENKKFED